MTELGSCVGWEVVGTVIGVLSLVSCADLDWVGALRLIELMYQHEDHGSEETTRRLNTFQIEATELLGTLFIEFPEHEIGELVTIAQLDPVHIWVLEKDLVDTGVTLGYKHTLVWNTCLRDTLHTVFEVVAVKGNVVHARTAVGMVGRNGQITLN